MLNTSCRTGTKGMTVLDQVLREVGHAFATATRTEAATLATEGYQPLVAAATTLLAAESMRKHSAA